MMQVYVEKNALYWPRIGRDTKRIIDRYTPHKNHQESIESSVGNRLLVAKSLHFSIKFETTRSAKFLVVFMNPFIGY